MVYRVLRAIARVALRWYYRRIETEGLDRVPLHGPAILAANHNNALVDALIVASRLDRDVRLTAKATLLENPLTRVVVRAVGIVPLRRASDEIRDRAGQADPGRNQGAFDAVVDTLRGGGVVLIFPEGKSHSEPELAPLRTGCARMALLAIERGAAVEIPIVPVGLTFEAKGRPRSRVLMHVGVPVVVSRRQLDAANPIAEVTSAIGDGLRRVTLNFATHADARDVLHLSRALAAALDEVRSLGEGETTLRDTVQVATRVDAIRRRLDQLPPAIADDLSSFVSRLEEFRRSSAEAGVPLSDVNMPLTRRSGIWFAVRELGLAAVCVVPALWGRLNHWLPLRAALTLGRATSRNPDDPDMHTLVGGLLLVLVAYAGIVVLIGRKAGWGWAVLYLASLPPAASLDFWWRDRLGRSLARARGYLALRRSPSLASWLAAERQVLRQEAERLSNLVERAG